MTTQPLSTQAGWQWPVNLDKYDRSLELSPDEAVELDRIWRRCQNGQFSRRTAQVNKCLERLLTPLDDILQVLSISQYHQPFTTCALMLYGMGRTQKAFWGWTTNEWLFTLSGHGYPRKSLGGYRLPMLGVAYLLGDFVEFHAAPTCQIALLAGKVFGHDLLGVAVDRVALALRDFGYTLTHPSVFGDLSRFVSLILLTNHSPFIEAVRVETLDYLYEVQSGNSKTHIERISRVLHAAGILPRPINARRSLMSVQADETFRGLAAEWVNWVERWYETSTLASPTRRIRYYQLLKAGRWMAARHPEITSPEQWTREIAAELIAAVDRMHSGEWISIGHPCHLGQPLQASAKAHLCNSIRGFFIDCQRWGWIPIRFDPHRSLATPPSISALRKPNPRIIPDDMWAKLLAAGLTLIEDDLPKWARNGEPVYPLEMIRALVVVWLFAGLRSDEILRLRVGCIRWDLDEASQERGSRICLLDVPVHKTGAAFTKPVDAVVGEAVAAWEKVRSAQAPMLDHKTGEMVHFLFIYRGRWMGKAYLNRKIIPMLCQKAGIAEEDARGPITSHRARSTIASQLFNAKEPMSLFELQAWLGHSDPNSTQYYARITPTKLMNSFRNAHYFKQNLRMIEVLIDQDAIQTGATLEGMPWKYYDLGHGYCTYEFFDQCPHRMACAKCPFYRPKASAEAQILEAKSNLQRMLQEIPLTDNERAAVEDGIEAVEKLATQLIDVPTPAGPTPRELGNRMDSSTFTPSLGAFGLAATKHHPEHT